MKNDLNEVTVYAPATVANIVCGFDVLGFALSNPCDKLTIRISRTPGVRITNLDSFGLPVEPEQNVIGASLLAMLSETQGHIGFDVDSTKAIKPGSGIGSSAASASGAVVGANSLLGDRFNRQDLIRFAMCGEQVASGVKHADNIAPCIYGGITLIRSSQPVDIVPLDFPPLFVTVIHPQIEVRTSDAREILRTRVLLKDAVRQWGNIAGLVAGFMKGDYNLISRSLEDVIVEPTRSILIPAFSRIKQESMNAGAMGGGISGSGPSIFMFSKEESTAIKVEKAVASVYTEIGLPFHTYVTTISKEGVQIR
ncbi:MAG TPA: homoserine kinase [Bacteroidia bacterium]|jgi:homoserine kinase|nr:homoserine kinase [Bacteroidia bacterium]